MFSSPQSLEFGTDTIQLPRVAMGDFKGAFQSEDGSLMLRIAHAFRATRIRREFRVDHKKLASDPYTTDRNIPVSASAYVVVDHPKVGYSTEDITALVKSLADSLTPETIAKIAASQA